MGSVMDYVMMELRLLRQTLGLSQEEFGRSIGYSASHVSSVETGGRSLTPDYAVALDRAYDPAFREGKDGRFGRMLRELSEFDPDWLRQWIEYEQQAKLLRWYEPAWVPGLLQTEAYARATLSHNLLKPDEVEQRVHSRLGRQAILAGEQPVQLVAVIDVMVLRRPVVGQPGVMAEQVAHLAKMAELPHVQILVVPEEAGIYPGLQGGFILATLGDGSMVTHLDHQVRAQVVNGADDLATLQQTWEVVRGEALSRRQSLDLIKKAAQTWTWLVPGGTNQRGPAPTAGRASKWPTTCPVSCSCTTPRTGTAAPSSSTRRCGKPSSTSPSDTDHHQGRPCSPRSRAFLLGLRAGSLPQHSRHQPAIASLPHLSTDSQLLLRVRRPELPDTGRTGTDGDVVVITSVVS